MGEELRQIGIHGRILVPLISSVRHLERGLRCQHPNVNLDFPVTLHARNGLGEGTELIQVPAGVGDDYVALGRSIGRRGTAQECRKYRARKRTS